MKPVEDKQWTRFVNEGISFNSETNVKHNFKKMCKSFGPAYLEFLKINYTICRDENLMSDEEFMEVNNVDPSFFEKKKENLYDQNIYG